VDSRLGHRLSRSNSTVATILTTDPDTESYDATSIILHWLVAALVAALWIGGETVVLSPTSNLHLDRR
jgi:hypothetical protein